MDNVNYGIILVKLGYSPTLWIDETTPETIINTWQGDCPFNSSQDIIDCCVSKLEEYEQEIKDLNYKIAIKEVDSYTAHYYRHLALGETERAERAFIELQEKQNEINSLFT